LSELIESVKKAKRAASWWLLFRDDNLRELHEQRTTILYSSPTPFVRQKDPATGMEYVAVSTMPRGTDPSDRTGSTGTKLASLERQEEWIKLVDEVEAALPERDRAFLHLRREYRECQGRRGWTKRVQQQFAAELGKAIGKEVPYHRNTFSQWWGRIVWTTAVLAARRGLI